MGWLLDPFQETGAAYALAELVLLAAACGPLGVWLLLHRQAFAAEGMTHGMLPGLVLATLAGVPLVLGAGAGALVAAGAIALAGRDRRTGTEAGVAVAVGALLGAGALLTFSADTPPHLEDLLFGALLEATAADVALAALAAAGIAIALTVAHRPLVRAAFDRTHHGHLLLLVALGAAVVVSARALGSLLSVALLLAPAAGALAGTPRLTGAFAWAAGIGIGSSLAGIVVAHHVGAAAGPVVAAIAVGAFAVRTLVR